MQVLCKASNTGSDVRCPVCGQGFLVYWTRRRPEERARRQAEVLESLRAHHGSDLSTGAHPPAGFSLPEWEGDAAASSLLGHAPAWAA